jgi:hypothetical protein
MVKRKEEQVLKDDDIRAPLATRPGAWVCTLCETVFGPEERGYHVGDATAPDLIKMLEPDQQLCATCFLELCTTPPPNFPKGGRSIS